MSQIGQKMSELEQKMRHGAWPALIWTAPLAHPLPIAYLEPFYVIWSLYQLSKMINVSSNKEQKLCYWQTLSLSWSQT